MPRYEFSAGERAEIKNLRDEKYATWEWNFANSPKYTFNNCKRFQSGIISVSFDVENGIIEKIGITGDFFGMRDIGGLEEKIRGCEHRAQSIGEKICGDFSEYIAGVGISDFLTLLF